VVKNIKFVSGNPAKIKMVQQTLERLGADIKLDFVDLSLDEIQSLDEIKVIEGKARLAFEKVNGPVVVDDEGFCLDAFNDFPGALGKFFVAGIGWKRVFEILSEQNKFDGDYYVRMAYVDEAGTIYHFREGVKGCIKSLTPEEIAKIPDKQKGFNFFYQIERDECYTELEKCLESSDTLPRAMVLKNLLKFIQGQQESKSNGEKY
jgi:inosine/xanthosine triphosphate pyrophosphatase family protein